MFWFIYSSSWTITIIIKNLLESGFSGRLTPSALGRGWPLIPRVRNGECVDSRLSHSLGLCSGTASMKFFFSSLMLAWCFSKSSWGLSNSCMEQGGRVQLNRENNKGRKNKEWKQNGNVHGEREDEGHLKKGEINRKKQRKTSNYVSFCCSVLLQIRSEAEAGKVGEFERTLFRRGH